MTSKKRADLIKTLLIDLINVISVEKKNQIKNIEYIDYIFDYYQSDSTDYQFIKWCDVGYNILTLWKNMYEWIDKNILNISIADIISKIKNSDLLSDMEFWSLNYQQFRNRFMECTIEDVNYRIDHIYLNLKTLIMNYERVCQ